jgi:hypothetical protein
MKKEDVKFFITTTSYHFLVKSLIFTISLNAILIRTTESFARSDMNTCTASQKTRCTQCFDNGFVVIFSYSCCDKDFQNCWPWNGYSFLHFDKTPKDMPACEKARDLFGCDEYCQVTFEPLLTRKYSCPSDKK